MSEAVLVTPAYDAEIVTGVDAVTALVLTVNVVLLAPAATVTLAGTVAVDVLLLERETAAPPVSAGPLSVTVPVEVCAPPVTLVGFSVSEERVGRACGSTVSEAVLVTPAYDAEMVTGVDAVTALVLTVNVALRASGGLPAASHTRGIQRQRGEIRQGLRHDGE